MTPNNVFSDEWDEGFPPVPGWTFKSRRLVPGRRSLGMCLYELPPGQRQPIYHFHHGNEELVLVLRGTPTLRTPEGERELQEGDAVHFPVGPGGAHQLINRSDEPALYVIAASHAFPEAIEYPDSGKVAVTSAEESQRGGRLWTIHRLQDDVDYFDGEHREI
ncbi:MAG TPA: cupin domain-containing protein [Gaiellaceae bacterium]|jgi:uncharacterized cupin superfamily protein